MKDTSIYLPVFYGMRGFFCLVEWILQAFSNNKHFSIAATAFFFIRNPSGNVNLNVILLFCPVKHKLV